MSGETGGPTGRILVVDDEESLRVTLGAFLREEGNEVTVVADYGEATAALEATDFDLVLSDVVLPGKSGIEVLARVRERDPGCPVVMLTGEPTLKTAAEAVRLGAFDYLAKPIRRAGVVQVARQALAHRAIVLENRRLERENQEHRERLEERVAEQTREISAIAEIGRIIGSSLDIAQVYERFADQVRDLLPFDWIAINGVDLERGEATLAFSRGEGVMGRKRGEPWPLEGTQTEAVVGGRSGLIVSGESSDALVRRFPGVRRAVEAGVRSSLMVPLVSEGSAIGVLSLGSRNPDAYSGRDLRLAGRIGNQIAGTIANARLHGALEAEAEQRRLSESRYRGFVEALPDMLFRVSSDGTFLDFSPGRGVQPIAQPQSFLNRKIEDVLPRKVARLLMEGIRVAIDRRAPVEREYQLSVGGERFDYEARLVAIGEDEVVAVIRDITERRRSQVELERLVTTDALTGLLNRRRLGVILDDAVRSAVRRGGQGAVIYLDIDGFKLVNDTHGHAAGDRVLRAVGEALRKGLRATDAVARTGGDEFMVVLPDADPEAALERANQLARRVSDIRLREGGEAVGATCSAGVVTFPAEGASTDDLIVFADVAMYRAKESGGNRAALYDPTRGGREVLTAMQRTRSMIMAALDHDRVRLVRQPVVGVRGGRPTMYEALARLEDEDGTIRMPVEFIPQAETLGLVERIDRRVVEGACERWRRYADAGEEMLLSVNMSPRSFGDEMLQFIDEQAEKWRVDRPALTVEITETAVARRAAQTEAFVRGLRERGFRVAMDDFGTGSTSFALMRELQLDYVKLDGSLIRNLAADGPGRDFVRAIAEVAHATGAEVVAEHVQDDETMAFLAECRVEYAQGYHLGKPEEFPPEPSGDSGE